MNETYARWTALPIMNSDVVVRFDRCDFGTGEEFLAMKTMKTDIRSDSEEVLGRLTVTYTKR